MEKLTASYPELGTNQGIQIDPKLQVYLLQHGSYILKVGIVQTGLSKCIITKTQRNTELPVLQLMTFIQHLGG